MHACIHTCIHTYTHYIHNHHGAGLVGLDGVDLVYSLV